MKQITLETFKKEVIEEKELVLVDFYQDFCPPCFLIERSLETIKKEYPHIKITRVNSLKEKEIIQAFSIQSVPFIMLFKDGKHVDDIPGALSLEEIRTIVEKHI